MHVFRVFSKASENTFLKIGRHFQNFLKFFNVVLRNFLIFIKKLSVLLSLILSLIFKFQTKKL